MITDVNYFSKDFSDLLDLLRIYNKEISFIRKCNITDFSRDSIAYKYNDIFLSFPYEIITASKNLGFSYYTIELFDLYHEIAGFDKELEPNRIDLSRERFRKSELEMQDKYLIAEIVEEFFHSLTYNYNVFLNNAKKSHVFVGIESEQTILYNLYNLYKGVIKDKAKQINLFWGINFTKEISDKTLDMLCNFIEQRLLVLNPNRDMNSKSNTLTFKTNIEKKIQWKGTQQELVELFYELIGKGWIPEIEYGKRRQMANSITELFDLESTKSKTSSDVNASFYQQFKGETLAGEWDLPFLDNKKYKRKFDKIIPKK